MSDDYVHYVNGADVSSTLQVSSSGPHTLILNPQRMYDQTIVRSPLKLSFQIVYTSRYTIDVYRRAQVHLECQVCVVRYANVSGNST